MQHSHNYRSDCDFLARHTEILELSGGKQAHAVVAPGFQGRVMTSTFGGGGGPSFGWINRSFIESRQDSPMFNNYGGEDRFWIGPEAGQFGLWFRPGDRLTFDDFRTPEGINRGASTVVAATPGSVDMTRDFDLTNYSKTKFRCATRRTVRLLDEISAAAGLASSIPPGLHWVGFETVNTLTNAGDNAWQPHTGLLCIWILGMFRPRPRGKIIVPIIPGSDRVLGSKVDSYICEVPADRLSVCNEYVLFTCDGALRTKIGISPRRAKSALGSWDPDSNVLTVVTFNLPAAAQRLRYVNSHWEIQKDPYAGDVVNAYNDGRDIATGLLLGPFYELESSSRAAHLQRGESIVHVHRTFHFTGELEALGALSKNSLGVDVRVISSGA